MNDKFVIDTNVAIGANGKNGRGELADVSRTCQLTCIELLENCKNLHIVIDNIGYESLIIEEYANHLSYAGEPGVGDMFFKYLTDNQHNQDVKTIHTVKITPLNDDNRGFEELPENTFDQSDRKFIATAIVAQAIIVYAADKEDWKKVKQSGLIEKLQIELKDLCPESSCK
jgi:hypothetical protein